MASPSSSSPSPNPSPASARKRTPHVIGAVAGAVIGGVLGAVVVQKVRRNGGAKRLVPAKVPVLAKRAASAMHGIMEDAKAVARATAAIAADTALAQVRNAAQQFVVDVASGRPPSTPQPLSPPEPETSSTHDASAAAAEAPPVRTSSARQRTGAKKPPTGKQRVGKKRAKRAAPRAEP